MDSNSINKKRIKSQRFEKIPYDCWCNVLLFFKSPSDLFSLCFCVKGLYEYLKRISPQATRNIVFRMNSFPEKETNLTHVTNAFIGIGDVDVRNYIQKNFSSKNYEELFMKILKKFRNLMTFDFETDTDKGFYDMQNKYLLKKLNLGSIETNLRFDIFLPKLNILNLKAFDDGVPKNDLFINFGKLPTLKKMKLCNWRFDFREGEFQKSEVQEILFGGIDFKSSPALENLKKLDDLEFLKMDKICPFKNLPELNSLKINLTNEESVSILLDGEVEDYRFMDNIRIMDSGPSRLNIRLNSKCEIKNLNSLRLITLKTSIQKLKIFNLPNLVMLKIFNCRRSAYIGFEFDSYKNDLIKLEYLRCSGYFFTKVLQEKETLWKHWKESLRYIEVNSEYIYEEELREEKVEFVGFKTLKKLLFNADHVRIQRVEDCKKLQRIRSYPKKDAFSTTIDFKTLKNLKTISIMFQSSELIHSFLEY